MHIASELLMSVHDVLRGLPGIYPVKLASHLRVLFAAAEQDIPLLATPLMLSKEELLSMFARGEGSRNLCVTPFGVNKLVGLYEQKALPLRADVTQLCPKSELLDYIASEKDLAVKTLQMGLRSEQMVRLLHDPASVTEEDFSHNLLRAIFEMHAIPDSSVLRIGSVQVTRYVSRVKQIGQKSAEPSVTFRWTSCDGALREMSR